MLVYLFVYVLAAVLIFQGVNLLGEKRAPTNVIPSEVRLADAIASRCGRCLVTYGTLLALVALLSHAYDGLTGALVPMRDIGFAIVAIYGLWLVFGRKVDYTPAKPAGEAHGHGH
jgi:hypothetical protein